VFSPPSFQRIASAPKSMPTKPIAGAAWLAAPWNWATLGLGLERATLAVEGETPFPGITIVSEVTKLVGATVAMTLLAEGVREVLIVHGQSNVMVCEAVAV